MNTKAPLDLATLRRRDQAGVEFTVTIQAPGGSRAAVLRPDDATEYLSDPFGWASSAVGLTRDAYQRWLEQDGAARCGAKTQRGERCKNLFGNQLDAEAWLKADGGMCQKHGVR